MRVLVITARGLRADYLGCYGNQWIGTPALDRLAAEGVVFDRHYADRPEPGESSRAWRTGRHAYPTAPGAEDAPRATSPDLLQLLAGQSIPAVRVADPRVAADPARLC